MNTFNFTGRIESLPEAVATYENAKQHLFIRINGIDGKEQNLNDMPFTMKDDLAVTYHVKLGERDGMVTSAVVTNDLLKHYGVSMEKLHKDALYNTERILQPVIYPLTDVLARMVGIGGPALSQSDGFDAQLDTLSFNGADMTVLTNRDSMYGAAVIAYDGVLDKIAEKAGTDLIVLPSSVHEVIILPDNGLFNYRELESMVKEINRNEVQPEERLSDHVYHYDREGKVFERAEDFEERSRLLKVDERVSIKAQLKDAEIECGKQEIRAVPQRAQVLG